MRWYLFSTAVVFSTLLAGQEILSAPQGGTRLILFPADVVILEAVEERKDLGCRVVPDKAVLGIDLKFHGGYEVSLPLREVWGNKLTVLFRVIPKGQEPVHFVQTEHIPEIEERTSGTLTLHGAFKLGQGSYHIDWLIRDAPGRYCSAHWDLQASLQAKDRDVTVALPPESVQPAEREQFTPEPAVQRAQGALPINVKLLVNFSPPKPGAAALDPADIAGLVSILRALARNPAIQRFSVTAFNLDGRQMLYRQPHSDGIDFPALGDALQNLDLGVVNVTQLASKNGDAAFLTKLLEDEARNESRPDAVIFVGLKIQLDSGLPEEGIKKVRELASPVFYLNYVPDRQAFPWPDTIGRVVKSLKGREYTISGPSDLCNAVRDTLSQILLFKQSRAPGGGFEGSRFSGGQPAGEVTAESNPSPPYDGGWRKAMGSALQAVASNRGPTPLTETAGYEPSLSDVSVAKVKLHNSNGPSGGVCSVSYNLSNRFHRSVSVTVDVKVGGEGLGSYVDTIGANSSSAVAHNEFAQCRPAGADGANRVTAIIRSIRVR